MTRILKVAFCVLTLFAAATLVGCGDKEKPTDKSADSATKAPADTADKGSDAK